MNKTTIIISGILLTVLNLLAGYYHIVGPAEPMKKGPDVEISTPSSNPWFADSRDDLKRLPKSALTEPVSIRLCVLRVQFQPDSNDRSTGTGQFNLTPTEESPFPIDPTPHNREFFESHMQAVRNYWLLVSDSLIKIDYDIYPIPGDIEGYVLPDSMAYYGPDGWFGDNLANRMEAFIIEAMELAQERDHIDYTRYDDFIIFHAGADMQNDVASTIDPVYLPYYEDMIPSPDDLPTGYKKIFREFLPGVSGALIMPEYASQDGQIVALNGFLAHEVGHILGLVDLYSTYSMASMVGYFSLMDNGHIPGVQLDIDGEVYSVYGAIPTYPGAWDRAFLGIEDVVEADVFGTYNITACEEFRAGTTLVKIPINDYEYFLIENRHPNPDGRAINLKADPETGVILGLIDGTMENFVAKYDYLLPGAGLLVWHIDEYIAYADYVGNGYSNWDNNTLQWDLTRLFVDVLEADGYQDMGFYVDYGDSLDMFFEGNNSSLTPDTRPSTRSNSGAETGVYITDISPQGRAMSFDFRREGAYVEMRMATGFPLYDPPIAIDMNDDGSEEFLAFTYIYLLGWNNDGTRLLPGSDTLGLIGFSGDTARFPFPIIAQFDTTISGFAIGEMDGSDPMELAVSEANGNITVFSLADDDSSGRIDPVLYFDLDEETELAPVFHDFNGDSRQELIIAGAHGKYAVIDLTGESISQGDVRGSIKGVAAHENNLYIAAEWELGKIIKVNIEGDVVWETILGSGELNSPVISDVDLDGSEDIVLTSDEGFVYLLDSDGDITFTYDTGSDDLSMPAILDVSGNVYPDIVFTDATNVFVIDRRGILLTGFPAEFTGDTNPLFYSPASVAGFSEGRKLYIPSGSGDLFCFDGSGQQGQQLSIGASSSPMQIYISGGETKGLLSSTDGSLYVLNLSIQTYESEWSTFPSGNNVRLFEGEPVDVIQVESGIINPYIWPNPASSAGNFRFGLGIDSDSEVKIEIYSHDGTLVDELSSVAVPGDINEINWSTALIPSGIYRARITCGDDQEMIKVAIVK